MATDTSLQNYDMSVLANYQALMGHIHSTIQSFGWQLSGDTGVTDPSGVGALPTANTYTNFQIYKPGDALTTFRLKVGFGRSGTNAPALQITLGAGSDGAGALTGNTTTAVVCLGGVTTAATATQMSGDTWRFGICFNPQNSRDNGGMFVLGRSVDGTGAPTADFVASYWRITGGPKGSQALTLAAGIANGTQQAAWSGAVPSDGGSWIYGTQQLTARPVPISPVGSVNPTVLVAAGNVNDFGTPNVTVQIPYSGVARTYLNTGFDMEGSFGNSRAFMLWE
jgi:hypothetical protein